MSNENNVGIINFINACNELVDGKFILADIKISKILKAISESDDVYNLIEESMINYDFDTEFAKCVTQDGSGQEKFILPAEEDKIIPLVFCLLVEIDSKRINFNDFIKAQYTLATNQNEEYNCFAKTIIIPFRNAVANYFNVDVKEIEKQNSYELEPLINVIDEKIKELKAEQEKLEEKPDEISITVVKTNSNEGDNFIETAIRAQQALEDDNEEIELLFNRLERLARILEDKLVYVRNPLKKSNIKLLLDALFEACEIRNVKIIVALVMAINNIAGNERSMRGEIKELNTICYDFYE